jgi:hypothetical protein
MKGEKKEIMKLTIMNPSFKNETVIYKKNVRNNGMEIVSPEKNNYKGISTQLN